MPDMMMGAPAPAGDQGGLGGMFPMLLSLLAGMGLKEVPRTLGQIQRALTGGGAAPGGAATAEAGQAPVPPTPPPPMAPQQAAGAALEMRHRPGLTIAPAILRSMLQPRHPSGAPSPAPPDPLQLMALLAARRRAPGGP